MSPGSIAKQALLAQARLLLPPSQERRICNIWQQTARRHSKARDSTDPSVGRTSHRDTPQSRLVESREYNISEGLSASSDHIRISSNLSTMLRVIRDILVMRGTSCDHSMSGKRTGSPTSISDHRIEFTRSRFGPICSSPIFICFTNPSTKIHKEYEEGIVSVHGTAKPPPERYPHQRLTLCE